MVRLRLGIARTGTFIATVFFWTWTTVKAIIALIGATTVGDDFNQLTERLPAVAAWVLSTPWWVPAALATVLTSFLIWLSWPSAPQVTQPHNQTSEPSDADRGQPQTRSIEPSSPRITISLRKGLYVGEIRIGLDHLADDRHSEITLRVFNGTGRTVMLHGLCGKISFATPNNQDPRFCGELPEPAVRNDTSRLAEPLEEWFLILEQKVPAKEADKLLAMINDNMKILFSFAQFDIEVCDATKVDHIEKLDMGGGVSYDRTYGYGKIVNLSVKETIGSRADTFGP